MLIMLPRPPSPTWNPNGLSPSILHLSITENISVYNFIFIIFLMSAPPWLQIITWFIEHLPKIGLCSNCFTTVVLTQLCLCDPMDCSPPGSSVRGIFPSQEYWSGLPFPTPGDLPDSGIKLECPAFVGGFFTTEPPGKIFILQYIYLNINILQDIYLTQGASLVA